MKDEDFIISINVIFLMNGCDTLLNLGLITSVNFIINVFVIMTVRIFSLCNAGKCFYHNH